MAQFEFPSSQSFLPLPDAFEETDSLGPLPPASADHKESSIDRYKLTGTLRQFSTDNLLNKAYPDLRPQIEQLATAFYVGFKTRTFPFQHPDADSVLEEWGALQLKVLQMKFEPSAPAVEKKLKRAAPVSERKACQKCRWMKQKCDKEEPCSNCVRYKRECNYDWDSVSPSPRPIKLSRPPPLSPGTETEAESETDS